MKFRVFSHPKAFEFLEKLDKYIKKRIKKKIKKLEKYPKKGKRLRYSRFWSLRIGNYRAVYEIKKDEKQVVVLFVGHRKNVYDDFSKML